MEDIEKTIEPNLTFADLGLDEQMLRAVEAKGFESPSPIQRLTIPALLGEGADLIAQAQTGTGKTAAFGLPLLQLLQPKAGRVQAIILVPTRELALQVTEELISFNHEKRVSVTAIYGGASIGEQPPLPPTCTASPPFWPPRSATAEKWPSPAAVWKTC